MGTDRVSLILLEGGPCRSDVEAMLRTVRHGIVLDNVARARACGRFDQVILGTDDEGLARTAAALGARVDCRAPGETFHFGERLRELVEQFHCSKVCYMGGAAAPLISREELEDIAGRLRSTERGVAANNVHSADVVSFAPAAALADIELPEMDNALPARLHQQGGLPLALLPRTLGIHFDVDTPTDVLILAVHPGTGPTTRDRLAALDLDVSRVEQAKRTLMDATADVVICGRVGAPLFTYLDQATRCRLRLFSEERGMKSLGREARGEVVSLVGHLLDAVGPAGFFERLASLCHTVFLDTRVLFAHARRQVSAADRFNADLGRPEAIGDPYVQAFTEAAQAAPIPVIVGGHSLVTGGIWALMDAGYAQGLDAEMPDVALRTPREQG